MHRYLRRMWLPGLLVAAHFALAGCTPAVDEAQQRSLEQRLVEEAPDLAQAHAFYAARTYRPIWVRGRGPFPRTAGLIDALCTAAQRGLLLKRYDPAGLDDAFRAAYVDAPEDDSARAERLAALELRLTQTALTLADHLAHGTVPSDMTEARWDLSTQKLDVQPFLNDVTQNDPGDVLDRLEVQHYGYTALREALARYGRIAEDGGWPRVPDDAPLQQGNTGEAVAALRQRLAATGDLPADAATGTAFDADVAAAVHRFQQRHGLPADSVADADVLAALNVPVEDRIAHLEANLERHRWLPEDFGDDYIVVNIPDYRLYGYRGGQQAMDMPVIVGKVINQTPAFADTMTHLIFRPYWNVPASIATDEIFPKLQQDPGYLASNRYEAVVGAENVVPAQRVSLAALENHEVRIRQQPGPGNALGLVKFMFPNEHNIYLHDTPADYLFDRADRGFSHGCVRVERPVDLAAFVLHEQDNAWTMEEIEDAMNGDENNQRIDLDHPLPVYLMYLTAWVDEAGQVQFREDVYGHDASLAQALQPHRAEAARDACAALAQRLDELD